MSITTNYLILLFHLYKLCGVFLDDTPKPLTLSLRHLNLSFRQPSVSLRYDIDL